MTSVSAPPNIPSTRSSVSKTGPTRWCPGQLSVWSSSSHRPKGALTGKWWRMKR